ncbi:MAG TPA: phosphotransferase, partial [Novosphingobium sp.]|nr:phosphotransferase [Novosphingobium sp.]
RIHKASQSAMLMHAPPPQEDPRPFLAVGGWLAAQGLRPPAVLAEEAGAGWVLLEDFGDARLRDVLDETPALEMPAYAAAIDTLVALRGKAPGPFPPYDMATYLREARLFVEWFCPAQGLAVDAPGWEAAWQEALAPLMARQQPGVAVLRDYHAENIMLLAGDPADQGLLDYQDALVGHPAYDLVSLLQDARRDVAPAVEAAMLARYLAAAGLAGEAESADFLADYARLGAQRNAKIVGIFVRLWQRDGKQRYLALVPRVWAQMERDLAHPALAPVARWFEANIPAAIRAAHGGSLAA